MRSPALLLFCCLSFLAAPAADAEPRARVEARLALESPRIRGRVALPVHNTSAAALNEIPLVLFANRFASESQDTAVDDVTRPHVYPSENFDPGWMDLGQVRVRGRPVDVEDLAADALPPRTAVTVRLPAPLQPGSSVVIEAEFTTHLPLRFGSFGHFQQMRTALGGWYPYVPPLAADGTWKLGELPAATDFDVAIRADGRMEVVLNGRWFVAGEEPVETAVDAAHYLTLVAAPKLRGETVLAGETTIVHLRRPPEWTDRRSFESPEEIAAETFGEIIAKRPPVVPAPPATLVVVEVPLRLELTAPGEGMVVMSDRSLDVAWVLRPFHQTDIAQAFYAEMLRPQLAAANGAGDFTWVSEGVSQQMSRQFARRAFPDNRSVRGWIETFNTFAIVDRFETAPKIPFAGTLFDRLLNADPLHQQITTFNNDLPPGHVVMGKLRQRLGEAEYQRLVAACAAAAADFRRCAARESHTDLDSFFAEWLQPYPRIDYSFADVDLNQGDGEPWLDQVTVQRHSSRPIHEPVKVQLRSIGGEKVDLRWDGSGDEGRLEARPSFRAWQAVIDPDHELIESTRADNASPPEPQIVVDTAEVQVSSTEFGLSALIVGRGRYDYRKDLAVAAVYTNRGIGAAFGGRYHWGEPIDPVSYRNNLYAFYSVTGLDSSFRNDSQPGVRTAGHVNGFGLRYDYNNILSYNNPTHEVQLQLYGDVYDAVLGSDYDFADWGASAVLTHPLWSNRTILAGQVFNGFSEPIGDSSVPNQNLYSLGGSRSIRGIGAEEELARNLFLVRAELRQTLYQELDLNFMDLLILRRLQLRPFVDTGRVSNSAGAIYDVSHWSAGFGLGFGAFYDFMGFFPSLAYFEIATSVDDPGDVQYLFGTRQSF